MHKIRIFIVALIGLLALTFIGCGEVELQSLNLGDDIEIAVGEKQTLTLICDPVDAQDLELEWSSSDETIVSINEKEIEALKVGEVTITVKSKTNSSITASVKVTVVVPPKSVEISGGKDKLFIGDELTLTATVLPEDTTNKTVTWTSSDDKIATVTNGKVQAIKAGTVTITAKVGTVSKTLNIIVDDKPKGQLTVEDLKTALPTVLDNYVKSAKGDIEINLINGDKTMNIVFKYDFNSDNTINEFAYISKGEKDNHIYIQDEYAYMLANDVKTKYAMGDYDYETIISDYGVEDVLAPSTEYYADAAFFAALTFDKIENGVNEYILDLTAYKGTILKVAGKDSIKLYVTCINEVITNVKLVVVEENVEKIVEVKYLGFNPEITFPADLDTYPKK